MARDWGLTAGTYVDVVAIANRPGSELAHHGQGAFLALADAKDRRSPGLALFPETLKGELNSVRKTIEQFSSSRRMAAAVGTQAAGLIVSGGRMQAFELRVTLPGGAVMRYSIDRWD